MSDLGAQRLTGRVAFVSGGLRGIGLACVERFLAEGAEVVLSDLDARDSDNRRRRHGTAGTGGELYSGQCHAGSRLAARP